MYRVDSHFDISELKFSVGEPVLYLSTKSSPIDYDFQFSGTTFKIKVMGKEVEIEMTDDNLRKIRHECVANVLSFQTDKPLGLIGVTGEESELTPDCIDLDAKLVTELTTSAIPTLSSLKDAYAGKQVRYNYLVEPKGFTLAIIVVSPSSVYTNMKLTRDVVECLCYRARIGLALESLISESLGTDIFSEDLSSAEQLVKAVFRGITDIPSSEKNFNVDKILSCQYGPSNEDRTHTARVLGKCLAEASQRSSEDSEDLVKYKKSFNITNSRSNMKRVTNIPMVAVIPSEDPFPELDPNNATMPSFLHKIWNDALSVKIKKESYEEAIKNVKGPSIFSKHYVQKGSAFNTNLNSSQQLEAAKTGLFAKTLKDHPEIREKDSNDHLSFHPFETYTDDIQEFMDKSLLDKLPWNSLHKDIAAIINHTKKLWNDCSTEKKKKEKSLSFKIISRIASSPLGFFTRTISDVMTEICYSYKYWIKRADFYHKCINGIHILIRPSGSHVFAIFAYPKDRSKILDTGRLGPSLFESNNYIFSDVCSFNEPTIEHFVKAAPYMTAITSHIISNFELSLTNIDVMDQRVCKTVNGILMLYLNNKTDVEELITSQRYFTMGILEDLDPNPYRFVDRLPEVLRSRLTCYFTKRTCNLLEHYGKKRLIKVPVKEGSTTTTEVKGLVSIFGNFELSLRQKINEFYYGYVISKERGRGSDRNFKIMKKIVSEEYRFRDTVKKTLLKTMEPSIHQSDHVVIRVMLSMYRTYMKDLYGPGFESVIRQEIIKSMAKSSFSELATLKVASRSYMDNILVPEIKGEKETSEIFEELKAANPEEVEKRPRVMEALARLVESYQKEEKKELQHPIQLLPFCLRNLEKKGYFDSDIFPKPQHGGDREIHVLEITARIVQFYVECISKTLCRLSPTDSLTHPSEKENFVQKHYQKCNSELKDKYFTMGKSADATKWCQRNHSSKFACILVGLSSEEFIPFIVRVMRLWQHKRITFPLQFAANFLSNRKTKSNPIYKRLQNDFLQGTCLFDKPRNNKMIIQSGMMQGILHYTSSLCHAVIQISMAIMVTLHMEKKGFNGVLSTIQGSDDSAALISIDGPVTDKAIRFATTMLNWKEKVSKWLSIYTSRAKSSIGSLDIVEYNSEWFVKSSVLKPTFRWVSACLETSVVEKFIDRVRMNYNTMSQVLEGGGKVLECAMIQICQAWLHYMMIGLHNHTLSKDVAGMIYDLKDPSLGFYPLDSDFIAGFTGVDFQLYHLFKTTKYGRGIKPTSYQDPVLEDDDSPENKDVTVSKDLRSAKIKFGSLRIWFSMIRRMKVPELIKIVEEVENNPYLIFTTHNSWEMSKYQIYLKVFQPGVKESVSSFSPVSRLMAASAYMINRPCVSILGSYLDPEYKIAKSKKLNLYTALEHKAAFTSTQEKPPISDVFPFYEEYQEILEYVSEIQKNHVFMKQSFKTRSKQKIAVFEKHTNDIPVSALCKKVWFNLGKVPLSRRQIKSFYASYQVKYPFLGKDLEETKSNLGLSTIEVKNFLESLDSKPRHIILLDTSAKSTNLMSSMTRVFWSNTKIMLPSHIDSEESSYSLRSKAFSIISSCLSDVGKKSELTKLIKSAKILKTRSPPNRVAKLKIIHDWMNNKSKHDLVFDISNHKLGSVGFFTVRQDGFGKNRKGPGEWRGSCLGIPTIVKMNGNVCTGIVVKKIYDMGSLGQVLMDLVKGFQLSSPDEFHDSDFWLSDSGKISGGVGKSEYIPMKVQEDLEIDIVDKVADYHWDWEILENRIRLVAQLSNDTKITVLSESLSSYDWDPSFKIPGDEYLSSWSSGSAMKLSVLEEELYSAVKMTPAATLKAMKDRAKIFTKSAWNLKSLISSINWMLVEEDIPDVQDYALPEDNVQKIVITSDEIQRMLFELNTMSTKDFEFGDWAEEVEMEQADLELFDSSLFTEELAAQVDLFQSASSFDDVLVISKRKMPKTNLCFESLNQLARLQLNQPDFRSAVRHFLQNTAEVTSGFLGLLLSLVCGRICYPFRKDDEGTERARLEVDILSVTSSVKTEADLDNIDIQDLDNNISYLNEAIKTAPTITKSMMVVQLAKYERLRALKTSAPRMLDSLESHITTDVIDKLRKPLIERKMIPESYQSLDKAVFHVVLTNELDTKIDEMAKSAEITQFDQSLYREAIAKPYITSLFLDAVHFRFGIKLKLAGYETPGDDLILIS